MNQDPSFVSPGPFEGNETVRAITFSRSPFMAGVKGYFVTKQKSCIVMRGSCGPQ